LRRCAAFAANPEMSDRAIAAEIAVDHKMVASPLLGAEPTSRIADLRSVFFSSRFRILSFHTAWIHCGT
jgi:hypothetical protein